ncbi:Murein DD-endopeptidase MepM [bacterium HR26]|nr:Murein DD-endopeptidase MepM [bacterium HR26]
MARPIESAGQRAWRWLRGAEPLLVAVTLAAWAARRLGFLDGWRWALDVLTVATLAALALIWSIRLVQWGRALVEAPRRVLLIAGSLLMTILSPPVLLFSLAQLGGELLVRLRYRGRLPAPDTYRQKVRYRLPVTGCWTVYNGGVTPETSHSWGLAGQRYAYDLVVCDEDGRSCRVDPARRPEDCYSWGQPVVAPAGGVVVTARDGHRDCPWVGIVDPFAWSPLGNVVVIRHAEREYSLLAHLQRGSVCVRPGQPVEAGQMVGRCGNSGHSTEPHLHFQVQDNPRFLLAASLPVQFDGWWRLGSESSAEYVSCGYLRSGDRACDCLSAEVSGSVGLGYSSSGPIGEAGSGQGEADDTQKKTKPPSS